MNADKNSKSESRISRMVNDVFPAILHPQGWRISTYEEVVEAACALMRNGIVPVRDEISWRSGRGLVRGYFKTIVRNADLKAQSSKPDSSQLNIF